MIIGIIGQRGSGKNTLAELLKTYVPRAVDIALADPLKSFCKEVFDFSDGQMYGPSEARNAPDTRYPREYQKHTWRVDTSSDPNILTCARCDLTTAAPVVPPAGPCVDYLTPREALQQLGTEWGRACYRDVWVEAALRRAKALLATCSRCKGEVTIRKCSECEGLSNIAASMVLLTDVRFENEAAAVHDAGGKLVRIVRETAESSDQHRSETEQLRITPDHTINNNGTLSELDRAAYNLLQELRTP